MEYPQNNPECESKDNNRAYGLAFFLVEPAYYNLSLVSVSLLKVGIPPAKINIFQR